MPPYIIVGTTSSVMPDTSLASLDSFIFHLLIFGIFI
jgi:hypothetical protein